MFYTSHVSAVYCLLLPPECRPFIHVDPPAKSMRAKNTRKRQELTARLLSPKGGNLEAPSPTCAGQRAVPRSLGLLPPTHSPPPASCIRMAPSRSPGRCPRPGGLVGLALTQWAPLPRGPRSQARHRPGPRRRGAARAQRSGGLPGSGGLCRGGWGLRAAGGWERGGDVRQAARGRGPEGRSYAVTIMAAVTLRPPAVRPFLRPAPGRESRKVVGSEEARPRLPSPRQAPRCLATWRRRCPAAPRRCGLGCRAVRLRQPPGSPQPPGLPTRATAATPLPWQPRRLRSPGCGRRRRARPTVRVRWGACGPTRGAPGGEGRSGAGGADVGGCWGMSREPGRLRLTNGSWGASPSPLSWRLLDEPVR